MAKGKDVRVTVILECTRCIRNGINKEFVDIFKYITQKNRPSTPSLIGIEKILSKLLLSKYIYIYIHIYTSKESI